MRNVTSHIPTACSTNSTSLQKAAASLDTATTTGPIKQPSANLAARMKAFEASAAPPDPGVPTKRASFNPAPVHQPHAHVARRQSYSEKVAMESAIIDPQVSNRRSSVASQRESKVREKFEENLPAAAGSTESLSPKIAEAIETLREEVLTKNPISPVYVPHVSAAQQVNSENHNQLAKMSIYAGDKCHKCAKIVYAVEKIQYDDFTFHKTCLKCKQCNATLKLGNVACLENEFFCKVSHF
ncbi:UNVERIFIED_CONTAM: LIM domain and actin-binding protein 1 [Siphonaria sp. JEL0065]|nr:LIM domain and actin-binding protein 1 [Siphonaria sp. JEL0065]